ncbi:hypothetical protein BC940DRAFT_301445 [Gongronella butleri]|nr:hypothetical protein BC940DRAFT_301445 [Gongronella butleri]
MNSLDMVAASTSLPSEVWTFVFRYLPPRDICQIALVSSNMRDIASASLYATLHLRRGDQLHALVQTLKMGRRRQLGQHVRRIVLYKSRLFTLSNATIFELARLTPNVTTIDFPHLDYAMESVNPFQDGPIWQHLTSIPKWMTFNATDLQQLRHQLTSLHCSVDSFADLAQFGRMRNLKKLVIESPSRRGENDRYKGSLGLLLCEIVNTAPMLVHLDVQARTHQWQSIRDAPKEFRSSKPQPYLQSLHIRVGVLSQTIIDFVHAKFPGLKSLSFMVYVRLAMPKLNNELVLLNARACKLEHFGIDMLEQVNDHEALVQPPTRVAESMLGCVAESPSPHEHPLKSLTWCADNGEYFVDRMVPLAYDVFNQLTELRLALFPKARIMCWLKTCAHKRCATAKPKRHLPVLKSLSVESPHTGSSQLNRKAMIEIHWDRVLARFPQLESLEMQGLIRLMARQDTQQPFHHANLKSLSLVRIRVETAATVKDIIESCPRLVELCFDCLAIFVKPATQVPIIIDTPERHYQRLYSHHTLLGIMGKNPHYSPLCPKLDERTIRQYPAGSAAKSHFNIILRCRSYFALMEEKPDEKSFGYSNDPFTFDTVHKYT